MSCVLESVVSGAAQERQYEGFAEAVTLSDGSPGLLWALALGGRDPQWPEPA
ncbi:hypothetical protein [Streptomyces sp. NPDC086010]|uniref:hypothetical protein n=1 Tax=Streptomyces sp. NPDC086010 TaxID=3365745 RepID=UPI0037D2180C